MGGLEVLPFGLLVFVVGTLLVANAWAVVDAKLTVEAAAREAGRAYTESPDPATARTRAEAAARSSVEGSGRDPDRLVLRDDGPSWQRCAVVTHEASYRLPAVSLPFVGGFGRGITVRGRHRELLDPYRSGLGGPGDCAN